MCLWSVVVVVLLVVASEFGWVAVDWALGGGSTLTVLVLSSLMMFSMRVSSSPVRVYRVCIGCIGCIGCVWV